MDLYPGSVTSFTKAQIKNNNGNHASRKYTTNKLFQENMTKTKDCSFKKTYLSFRLRPFVRVTYACTALPLWNKLMQNL